MRLASLKWSLAIFLVWGFWLQDIVTAETPAAVSKRQTLAADFHPPRNGKVKVAFFDADSTLRVAPSGKPSANDPNDVAILPMVPESLKRLANDGFLIYIVSNQAGVEAGYITSDSAEKALALTVRLLAAKGGVVHGFDFAESRDENRKPDIGMAKRLITLIQEKYHRQIDWDQSLMVGDSAWKKGKDIEPDGSVGVDFSDSDRLFAENLKKQFGGVTFIHPREFFGWQKKFGIKNFDSYQTLQKILEKHPEYR